MLDFLLSTPVLAFVAGVIVGAVGGVTLYWYLLRRAFLEAVLGKAGASLFR